MTKIMEQINWPTVSRSGGEVLIWDTGRHINVTSYPFLSTAQANWLYSHLVANIQFDTVQSNIPNPNGGFYNYPRQLAYFSDDLELVKASGYASPQPWEPVLDSLRKHIQEFIGDHMQIDSCLLNHYRTPQDKIAAHSDRETSYPYRAVIALTLAPYFQRRMIFREKDFAASGPAKYNKNGELIQAVTKKKWEFRPAHGSLYVMMGPGTQKYLTHESPGLTATELKAAAQRGLRADQLDRISVTWRDLAGAKKSEKLGL